MQENNHFQSLGICHRLFKFVKNILIARGGLKRVTLGGHPPPPHGSTTVPVDNFLMNEVGGSMEDQQLSDNFGDKITIQFKETDESDESESWTPVDALGYSVHVSKENSPADNPGSQAPPLMSSEQKDEAEGNIIGKSSLEIEAIAMKDEAEEAKKKQKQEEDQPETTQMKAPPVTHARPRFSSVLANINEISEAFIRSRKEAMEEIKL